MKLFIRNTAAIILFSTAFISCKPSLQNQLADKIKQDCGVDPTGDCRIALANVTTFKWDRMYLFEYGIISDSISSRIGFKYSGDNIPSDTQRIIFTDGKQVVYEENFDYLNGDKEVQFNDSDDTLFTGKKYCTPAKAIFKVWRDKEKKHSEYYLTRVATK